ncbi:hypothetical protein BDZ97DRAFT_1922066 [Flammula alnicola]|nr:hypothetical protein BDZ97DRAFT_1922066 [Flammula alnicola]
MANHERSISRGRDAFTSTGRVRQQSISRDAWRDFILNNVSTTRDKEPVITQFSRGFVCLLSHPFGMLVSVLISADIFD